MSSKIILYGHARCPMVPPTEKMLQRAGATYEFINIHHDTAARLHVQEINDGYESVPTLVFPDGTTLTEPSGSALKQKLESLGYTIAARSAN